MTVNNPVPFLSHLFVGDKSLKEDKWLEYNHLSGESLCVGRDEATRTPDPYVPNVVRYQLRYIPILRMQRYVIFLNNVQEKR